MSEKKPMPKCPYCGAEMRIEKPIYADEYDASVVGAKAGWCTQATCTKCWSVAPFVSGMETEKDAYEAVCEMAMRRWQEPNRVLTLEEVTADTEKEDWSFMWIERKYDEKYALQYCGWYATDTWVILVLPADEKKIYELKSDYGKTWRCWLRKPTLEEMAETPWGAKHNEH